MQLLTQTSPAAASIRDATSALRTALGRLPRDIHKPTLARIEVPLDAPVSAASALAWLASNDAEARVFWADRDDKRVVAGVGEAWHVGGLSWTLGAGVGGLARTLAAAPRRLRLFGGVCFHGELRSHGPWKAFGAWRFALPLVELGRDEDGAWLAVAVQGDAATWSQGLAAAEAALSGLHAGAGLAAAAAVPALAVLGVDDAPAREAWRAGVERATEAFAGGDVRKVVLARQRRVRLSGRPDPVALLARLSAGQPESFRFCLQPRKEAAFVGASPERLLALKEDVVRSEALAGTRPRGADDAEDVRLAAALRSSDKDGREHAMVVAMVRETLSRVCDDVETTIEPQVMALRHVQHLHTPMTGRLRAGQGVADLLVALHPTPAVCGTPRAAAQQLIAQLEPFQRGLYAAPVGWLGGGGEAEFTVAIRSALVEGDAVSLYSGAGLVRGSDADAEWAEIDGKIAALWQALQLSDAAEPASAEEPT